MRAPIRILATGMLAVSAAACTTAPVNSVWTAQPPPAKPYQRVMIVGVATNNGVRLAYEDNFVTALAEHGIRGVASHEARPKANSSEPRQLEEKAQKADADAIIVTHLVAEDGSGEVQSHRAEEVPLTYRQLDAYMRNVETVIREVGYYGDAARLELEANIYDTKHATLVWSGRSRALKPDSEQTTIRQIITDLIAQMETDGYLAKPAKSAEGN